MKKILLLTGVIILTLIAQAYAQTTEGLTLRECYQSALKQSETIAIQQQVIKEAQARFQQALSGILPDVSFSYSQKRQDAEGANSLTRYIPEGKFVFSQPLFTGFKEFAAISAGKSERRQRQYEEKRARQLLFVDVSDAFYLFLGYQQDLEALDIIYNALIERVEELKKREELGRSRLSEVASAQARLSRVEAEKDLVLSQEDVSRQLLEFLTGQKISSLKEEANEEIPLPSYEEYLPALTKRPDVLAGEEAWKAAQAKIRIAQAAFWPAVSLDGNSYTKRTGTSEGIDWDVTLKVDVPIFKGGENTGKFKEAEALANEEKLRYEQIKRQAVLNIENEYTKWSAVLRRVSSLTKAYEAAQKNYELQSADYRLNLVNNLDVLQALQDRQDTYRDLIAVKNEAQRAYWTFKLSIGEIPYDAF